MERSAPLSFITRDHFRYFILVLSTLCISSIFSNIVSINFTLNCMDPSSYNNTKVNFPLHTFTMHQKSEIQWSISLASMLATFPFSYASTKFGAKYIFLVSGLISSITTLLLHAAIGWSFGWLILVRIFQGLAYAADFAVVGVISTRWASLSDVSIFISMLTLFPAYSNVFTNAISGVVCSSIGWPWVHYIHGILCLFLFILWLIFYTDNPKDSKFVSSKELSAISKDKTEAHRNIGRKIPYLKICKHPVVLSVWLCSFVDLFAAFFFIIYNPTYNARVLKYNHADTGFFGALETIGIIPLKLFAGYASDRYNCVPERPKMWIYNTLCTVVPALIFIVVCFLPVGMPLLTIILFAISNASIGFNGGGYYRCCCLVTRQYAEFVLAFTQFIKSAVFFIAPALVELFVKDDRDKNQWNIVFWLMAAALIVSNAIFCFFATDKPANFTVEDSSVNKEDVERTRSITSNDSKH